MTSAPSISQSAIRNPQSVQRRLPMTVDIRTPLMSICGVKAALRCDEDHVLYMIADKQLVAFDLKTPTATKQFPRIVAASVSLFQNGASNDLDQFVQSFDEQTIFTHSRPFLKGTDLMRDWNVVSGHIHNLITAGSLKTQNNSGDTVNKTPLVTRASALAFLKERRL